MLCHSHSCACSCFCPPFFRALQILVASDLCSDVQLESAHYGSQLLMSYAGELCPSCTLETKMMVMQIIPPEIVAPLKAMNPGLAEQVWEAVWYAVEWNGMEWNEIAFLVWFLVVLSTQNTITTSDLTCGKNASCACDCERNGLLWQDSNYVTASGEWCYEGIDIATACVRARARSKETDKHIRTD